jgi:hypothetical protein
MEKNNKEKLIFAIVTALGVGGLMVLQLVRNNNTVTADERTLVQARCRATVGHPDRIGQSARYSQTTRNR